MSFFNLFLTVILGNCQQNAKRKNFKTFQYLHLFSTQEYEYKAFFHYMSHGIFKKFDAISDSES